MTCRVIAGDEKYTGDIVIPSTITYKGRTFSVTEIGGSAFYDCTNLTSVHIGDRVETIYRNAFAYCSGLTSVDIPNSVLTIGNSVFSGCTNLTSVSIGNGVKSINNDPFYGCPNIESIQIGNNCAMDYILEYKDNIPTLIIAEDYSDTYIVTSYYPYYTLYTLKKNSKLSKIISKMARPVRLDANGFSTVQYMNLEVIVPTESLAAYQSADVWKDFWELKGGAEDYITTAIHNVPVANADKPAAIYDLQGRKLSTPRRGINIICGKKVWVK